MEHKVQSVFIMTAKNSQEIAQTRLLIRSLRTFGGVLQDCPVWIFIPPENAAALGDFGDMNTEIHPLSMPEEVKNYWFARKVFTCAQAERNAEPDTQSLIWFSYDCFIIQPPVLLQLNSEFDAAFRPVHGTNIGLPVNRPLDDFWRTIYEVVKLPESQFTVESYVDQQLIRAYFNSHIFSWNPSTGLGQRWFEVFRALVGDRDFQLKACQDIQHQVFLHQAVLSALVDKLIPSRRLRMLPPVYSYPYNMHGSVPLDRRARSLNEMVCIAYEDRSLHPSAVCDIDIRQPLKGWLFEHIDVMQV